MVSVVIHTNLALDNQKETAGWLKAGLAAHGIKAEITADKTKKADVQIVQGNWYCLNYWQPHSDTNRVLYLSRCFYGSPRFDISLGWLRPDGSRDFVNDGIADPKGTLPRVKRAKDRRRCAIVFCDYGKDHTEQVQEARMKYDSVFCRPHPAQKRETPVMAIGDLEACWALGDVALGHSSTVLVDAVINGLHAESTDPRHVIHKCNGDRERWLAWLSWANWNYTELIAGDWVEHFNVKNH